VHKTRLDQHPKDTAQHSLAIRCAAASDLCAAGKKESEGAVGEKQCSVAARSRLQFQTKHAGLSFAQLGIRIYQRPGCTARSVAYPIV
jgi:hypothetical protein